MSLAVSLFFFLLLLPNIKFFSFYFRKRKRNGKKSLTVGQEREKEGKKKKRKREMTGVMDRFWNRNPNGLWPCVMAQRGSSGRSHTHTHTHTQLSWVEEKSLVFLLLLLLLRLVTNGPIQGSKNIRNKLKLTINFKMIISDPYGKRLGKIKIKVKESDRVAPYVVHFSFLSFLSSVARATAFFIIFIDSPLLPVCGRRASSAVGLVCRFKSFKSDENIEAERGNCPVTGRRLYPPPTLLDSTLLLLLLLL